MPNIQKICFCVLIVVWALQIALGQNLSEPVICLNPDNHPEFTSEYQLNYNGVFNFSEGQGNYPELSFVPEGKGLTIFTVFLGKSLNQEETIWFLSDPVGGEELLTTNRVINLEDGSMISYQLRNSQYPHFNHYVKGYENVVNDEVKLSLGSYNGLLTNIPANNFKGIIGETRVYDFILSKKERHILSTYYALKYGLYLTDDNGEGYRNSSNGLIWSTRNNKPYNFRIAGIGRDDETGFLQKQSASSYGPDIFSVAVGEKARSNTENRAELPNQSFLLWGDNGEELEFLQDNGLGKLTPRKWLFHASGVLIDSSISIEINQRRWLNPPSSQEQIWLVVDKDGSGEFSANTTQFYPFTEIKSDGLVEFSNIANTFGDDFVVTFSVGPQMMPVYWADSLLCTSEEKGNLIVGVAGGQPPFQYTLLNVNGEIITSFTASNHDRFEINDLEEEEYILEIVDATGRYQRKQIYGCPQQVEETNKEQVIANHYLYPNPTKDGSFKLILRLKEPLPVEISVVTANGQSLEKNTISGGNYLEYKGYLPKSGTYFLKIMAGNELLSLPIIRS